MQKVTIFWLHRTTAGWKEHSGCLSNESRKPVCHCSVSWHICLLISWCCFWGPLATFSVIILILQTYLAYRLFLALGSTDRFGLAHWSADLSVKNTREHSPDANGGAESMNDERTPHSDSPLYLSAGCYCLSSTAGHRYSCCHCSSAAASCRSVRYRAAVCYGGDTRWRNPSLAARR
jgi:hypothetical protein